MTGRAGDLGFLTNCVATPREKYLTTQHERDVETGLDYRGARFYDSDLGRFLSVDALANEIEQIDLTPYNYVWGNPVVLTDPDGNCPWCIVLIVMAIVSTPEVLKSPTNNPTADAAGIQQAEDVRNEMLVNALTMPIKAEAYAFSVVKKGVTESIGAKNGNDKSNDTKETSNAARREAMRQEGIPTSQQPVSQSKNEAGREYTYETPKSGGGTEHKSAQQQTMDSSHQGEPHWEAGKVKKDPVTGETRKNQHGTPKISNDKSKVHYNENTTSQ